MTKSPDRSYQFLAAHHVRRQAKQLAEQLEGVRRAEDIEFIHRARVASRRLRSALKMFPDCFSRKTMKRWRKQIRRVTEGLGAARDKDVQIDFLCGILSAVTDKSCFPGIVRLLAQLEHERDLLQPTVVKAVDGLVARKALDEMQTMTKAVLTGMKGSESKGLEPSDYSDFTRAQTRRHILSRLEEMLCCQDSLENMDDRHRHHAMRIAAKRLRYTVEIAKPVYGPALDEIVAAIKRVQTLLGDIHDGDVWLEHLDAYAADQRRQTIASAGRAARFARLEAGINYLRQERRCHRQQVFQEMVDYWRQLRQQGFWDNLVRLVESGVPAAPAPPATSAAASVQPPAPPLSHHDVSHDHGPKSDGENGGDGESVVRESLRQPTALTPSPPGALQAGPGSKASAAVALPARQKAETIGR
jgi:CHAD domain-containing protein